MLLVPVEKLEPAMKLARPVLHPGREDLLLLRAGLELRAEMIAQLIHERIRHVWIEAPGFEEVEQHVDEQIARCHMDLYRVLNESIQRFKHRVALQLDIPAYREAIRKLLMRIIEHPAHEVVTQTATVGLPPLPSHLANCSYLSLLLGAHLLGYLREQRMMLPTNLIESTTQLGLGSLLHDIGKVRMPGDLQKTCVYEKDAETDTYQRHATMGYDMVRTQISPIAANIVLHHHQRYDGRGFPGSPRPDLRAGRPCSDTKIHIFSRIVAVVNTFDHLLENRGVPTPTIVALHQLQSPRFAGWFDPVVVDALLRMVPPFTAGSTVRVSSGEEAVVLENHPEAPCKPTIKFIRRDEPPTSLGAARLIDLRLSPNLKIVEVDGVDVSPYLYSGVFEPLAAAG